eukprot:1222679-Pyramimonas_sp.AAC.1
MEDVLLGCFWIGRNRDKVDGQQDSNSIDESRPEHQSRLVIAPQSTYNPKEKGVFAAAPPLEGQGLLFSMAVIEGVGSQSGERE